MKTISIFFFLTKMFSRYYKKYYKKRYKKKYRRRYAPLYKRVINNSSRSRVTVNITNTTEWAIDLPAQQYWASPLGIHPFCEVTAIPQGGANLLAYKVCCSMVNTSLYKTFAALYEQVKLDAMTVQITALQPMSNYNGSLEFHTAWDRKCSLNELHKTSNNVAPGAGYYPTSAQLSSLASHASGIATTNSIPIIKRTIWASDLLEKTQFIDTDYGSIDTEIFDTDDVTVTYNADWMGDLERAGLTSTQFCPIMFLGVECHQSATVNRTIPVKIEVTYKATFRNPKYGGSSGASTKLRQKVPVGTTTGLAQAIKQELAAPIADEMGDGTGVIEAAKRTLAEALGGADPTGEISKIFKANPGEDVNTALRRIWSELSSHLPNLANSMPTIPLDFQNGAISSVAAAALEQMRK